MSDCQVFRAQMSEYVIVEFKDVLKELRQSKSLSQRELSKLTGLSFSIISQWERGKREPSGYCLKILAKFFEVSTDYLLGLED